MRCRETPDTRGFFRRHTLLTALGAIIAVLALGVAVFAFMLNHSLGNIERVPVGLTSRFAPHLPTPRPSTSCCWAPTPAVPATLAPTRSSRTPRRASGRVASTAATPPCWCTSAPTGSPPSSRRSPVTAMSRCSTTPAQQRRPPRSTRRCRSMARPGRSRRSRTFRACASTTSRWSTGTASRTSPTPLAASPSRHPPMAPASSTARKPSTTYACARHFPVETSTG